MLSCTASQMFALDRSSRALLATSAFAAFAGAFVTTPFAARGAADDHIVRTAPARPAATAGPFALILPRRDPFTGDPPAAHPISPPTALMSSMTSTPSTSEIPAAIRPLPPNAGAAGSALPFAVPPRITAVVTGAHPLALLDEGGTARVVTVGDRIDGAGILAVTAAGVKLSDGTMLMIATTPPTGASSPLPIPKGHQP